MSNQLITLQAFLDPYDAHVAKSQVDAAGIFCFLKNEAAINANPLLSNAMGWIELQVREGDLEFAKRILC